MGQKVVDNTGAERSLEMRAASELTHVTGFDFDLTLGVVPISVGVDLTVVQARVLCSDSGQMKPHQSLKQDTGFTLDTSQELLVLRLQLLDSCVELIQGFPFPISSATDHGTKDEKAMSRADGVWWEPPL